MGKYPGTGKTFSIKQYLEAHPEKKALVVSPMNKLKSEIASDFPAGTTVMTLHALLNEGIDGTVGKKGRKDLSGYDVIAFDEIYLFTGAQLLKIYMLCLEVRRARSVVILATGDPFQNEPPGNGHSADYCQYIIERLFQKIIYLTIPKRIVEEKRAFYTAVMDCLFELRDLGLVGSERSEYISNMITRFGFPTFSVIEDMYPTESSLNITYLNDTASWLNGRVNLPFTSAVCCKYICHGNSQKVAKSTFHTNMTYSVKEVTFTPPGGFDQPVLLGYDVLCSGLWIRFKPDKFLAHFSKPYARTCHSLQGSTSDLPVNIFDIGFRHVDYRWLVVALSRNRSMDIRIWKSGRNNKEPLEGFLASKIQNYLEQDIKRETSKSSLCTDWIHSGMITVEQYMNKLKNPVCIHCNNMFPWRLLTLDRIIDDDIHSDGNCVLACYTCNIARFNRNI